MSATPRRAVSATPRRGVQYTVQEYSTLYRSTAHCTGVQYTVQEYSTLYRSTAHCTGVQHTVQDYSTLYRSAVHCTGVQYTVQEYSALYNVQYNVGSRVHWVCTHCILHIAPSPALHTPGPGATLSVAHESRASTRDTVPAPHYAPLSAASTHPAHAGRRARATGHGHARRTGRTYLTLAISYPPFSSPLPSSSLLLPSPLLSSPPFSSLLLSSTSFSSPPSSSSLLFSRLLSSPLVPPLVSLVSRTRVHRVPEEA
jgi:hypothetical protein